MDPFSDSEQLTRYYNKYNKSIWQTAKLIKCIFTLLQCHVYNPTRLLHSVKDELVYEEKTTK